jgi:hypothetical protein
LSACAIRPLKRQGVGRTATDPGCFARSHAAAATGNPIEIGEKYHQITIDNYGFHKVNIL